MSSKRISQGMTMKLWESEEWLEDLRGCNPDTKRKEGKEANGGLVKSSSCSQCFSRPTKAKDTQSDTVKDEATRKWETRRKIEIKYKEITVKNTTQLRGIWKG